MKRKVVNKGYTITVTSWENDGDNYKTKSITVESKDKAAAIAKMCRTLFKSHNNGEGGIGNMGEDERRDAKKLIVPFMKDNPVLYDHKTLKDDELVDICMDINTNLMGYSEYYYSRVCESVIITFSDKDIEVEEVKL